MLTEQLQTLKVYELEPLHKHLAIFDWFDKLNSAESFIIENDHDPLPLYYELQEERKDQLGGFDYLEKGPKIWKVKITKAAKEESSYGICFIAGSPTNADGSNSQGVCAVPKNLMEQKILDERYSACSLDAKKSIPVINELDVTKLQPSIKHATIYEWFGQLQPGQAFNIKNDHDPKPLYYQMIGELGPVFSWNYTEQGPVWWKVTIQKKLPDELTIGEIAAKDVRKAESMKKLGIDFCCGGKKSIRQAADEAGIPVAVLENALDAAELTTSPATATFDRWELDFLADYIYNQHHRYYYDNREHLLQLVTKVQQVHGKDHPELISITLLVKKLFDELNIHFLKEERVLFPYIKELVTCKKDGVRPLSKVEIAKGPLAMMQMEHEAAGDILKTIRNASKDYEVPGDACGSYRMLYAKLSELENDLHQHIHLENNILFSKALQLEKELLNN